MRTVCYCLASMLALASTLVPALAEASGGRDAVAFNFGWKFRTGLHSWAVPDAKAPTDTDPGLNPNESKSDYDDSDWRDVSLPHDGLIANQASQSACPDGCSGKSFIPRHVLWYRKTFSIPVGWGGSVFFLDFGGSFRNTTVWVNGDLVSSHECGYTPFRIRLDNITSVKAGGEVTIAVFVDPDNGDVGGTDHGSGWWYEGGGLYRSVELVRTSQVHVDQDGLFAYSNVTGGSSPSAVLHAKVDLINVGVSTAQACVKFSVVGPDGSSTANPSSSNVMIPAGGMKTASVSMDAKSVKLWSSSQPFLYTVTAAVYSGSSCSGSIIDEVDTVHGFRSLYFDANEGMFLNGEHFKVRGFCDHNNFAVVGMAVPPRINLFRAQASRGVGGNGRRTSHNPPNVDMLDIYDRIGIVVMDENRLFDNNTAYVDNMGVLIKRDRNHPSVIIWSFCNEAGCEGSHENGGPRFQAISDKYDGTRPTLANMFTFNDLLSHTIDIQGFSHQSRQKLESCHEQLPKKPIFMSECCSCNTMRDEDVGCETLYDNPHNLCTQMSFNARCAESNQATNASDGVDWAVGTMVWTLFDYYGEPPVGGVDTPKGAEVSSTYGQYDLAGFPKSAAFWYRVQWLLSIDDNPDKTFPTKGSYEVHLVESWESPDSFPSTRGNKTRSIHAYSNAPQIELLVNGKSQGIRSVRPMHEGPGSYAEWTTVPWEAGEITAVAKDSSGKEVARTSKYTNGKAAKLELTIDAPSVHTGTGSALLLDGHDAALLRAAVVDADGRVMHMATNNITFRVVSGPGTIQGAGNGDPRCHEPNDVPWHSAYHGLVRAVVRVTATSGRSEKERALLSQIDHHGPLSATAQAEQVQDAEPIVVEASTPGFAPVTVSIPTSNDASVHSVNAAAAAAAGQPVNFFQTQ